MAIPWITLLKHAPAILSLSREVLRRTRQAPPPAAGAQGPVQVLAADLQRQAEVLHALAGQVDGLTAAVAVLRRALVWAGSLGAVACLLAAAALIVALTG
ncbi:MAG TPA: hypothetical protein VD811_10875 [Desulfuromonadales bacterium]|nr:hypothetical protein [Desulfuromonadales bacterium]